MVKFFLKLVDKQKSYDLLKFFGLRNFARPRYAILHIKFNITKKNKKASEILHNVYITFP